MIPIGRKTAVLLCFLLCLLIMGGCHSQPPETQRDIFAMDTYMHLKAYGEQAPQALREAAAEIQRLEALFSVNESESDIARLRKADGQSVTVAPETAELLNTALTLCEHTDGALDITIYPVLRAWGFTDTAYTVPSADTLKELLSLVDYRAVQLNDRTVTLPKKAAVDLGAVAKGYTGDRLCALLRQAGVTSALLNLGGNVQAVGTKPDGTAWQVGIADPKGGEPVATVAIEDCAVVTSGSYERFFVAEDGRKYHHILDPQTGYPVDNGLVSVTVIGKSGVLCDALSTAFFVMGLEKSAAYWKTHPEIEALWMTEDNKLYLTEGLVDLITTKEPYTVIKRGAS